MAASRFSLPTVVLLTVFVVGVCVSLWRQGDDAERVRRVWHDGRN
jgi:hypothetical protein